jgi:hypothetical protein
MAQRPALGRLDHLSFKGNLRDTRYGWLRLTPAYSVHVVADILDREARPGDVVLDPFCGTGTTALVCAERGIECDTTDINPFLLWLVHAKTARYAARDLLALRSRAARARKAILAHGSDRPWTPPLHKIEKWWPDRTLTALGRALESIDDLDGPTVVAVTDLLKIAFCQTMIEHANVSFGHQSMSFKKRDDATTPSPHPRAGEDEVAATWKRSVDLIAHSAQSEIRRVPKPIRCDARNLTRELAKNRYGCVITSPPYPNRMSYIRELRPYMFWLGYLQDGRQAGELDWEAVGGTWGCATSNVARWTPASRVEVPYEGFDEIVTAISKTSQVLGRYVAKYFHDVVMHCESLFKVVARGGSIHYVVGNSKFYAVTLPVEQIYAAVFSSVGFANVQVRTLRKRTSKKELFEFVVSASKPYG